MRLKIYLLCLFLCVFISFGCVCTPGWIENANDVGRQVEQIATAIVRYKERNGKLPSCLSSLTPEFLPPNSLRLQSNDFVTIGGMHMIYYPSGWVTEGSPSGGILAVMSDLPTGWEGRFVILDTFEVWYVEEATLQHWISNDEAPRRSRPALSLELKKADGDRPPVNADPPAPKP